MRKRIAVAALTLALGGGIAVLPASPAAAAYTCHYSRNTFGYWQAGYYSGTTVQPSTTGVSSAGIEAQCLLKHYGYNPGTIDGVFGPNSQSAARRFQADMNSGWGYDLDVDGKIGPESWPPLRVQP
ncbi:peptidoglycan-binding domain-containing protein [Cryptosporangium phraense]|uniref:Peptidoglycan binding-like domain-containing protein n=1 Tax=Cryptosporangium phraense TaxID=2593070 RepID=A0A545ART9_9ACTN|nr:peptidoglycan-binding domain-containing protein [Cryptosporangium phraense]TQS44050.1 hypothetical protein FL583_16480 [Cryptosporangium phraense]